jgi:hypothetical protein
VLVTTSNAALMTASAAAVVTASSPSGGSKTVRACVRACRCLLVDICTIIDDGHHRRLCGRWRAAHPHQLCECVRVPLRLICTQLWLLW